MFFGFRVWFCILGLDFHVTRILFFIWLGFCMVVVAQWWDFSIWTAGWTTPYASCGRFSGLLMSGGLVVAGNVGGQGGGWRFGRGGGAGWQGERRRLPRLRRAGVRTQVARRSLARLPGRLPKTHATGIAYGATDSRPFPFTTGSVFLSIWWLLYSQKRGLLVVINTRA